MSQGTLIYADALQTNEDINLILQAFRTLKIDDPTMANAAADERRLPGTFLCIPLAQMAIDIISSACQSKQDYNIYI